MGFSFVPLGIGFIRLLAAMPPSLGVAIGRLIGTLLFITARSRRLVCERNISVSFPELSLGEQKKLVKQCFIQNGVGLTETAWSWHRPMGFIDDKVVVTGQELLHAAKKKQIGVLLLCPHYSMLDLVAPLMHAVTGRFVISYRPNDNPTFDQVIRRGRTRYAELVDVRALREIAKHLKEILDTEKTKFKIEALVNIVNTHYPDIRKMLNTIQLSTKDNELVLDESIIVSSNYIKQVIAELKQKKPNFRTLRQIIADSGVKDFEELYRSLFDYTSEYAKGREGSVAVILNEHQYHSNFRIDKEINIASALAKIIETIKPQII